MKIIRVFRWLIDVFASLYVAVGLLALDVGVLMWATFMEHRYGTAAAHFAIYDTAWFLGLNAALAANVVLSILIRFPWRRRHAGFLLTHVGILVLLAGCLLSWFRGVSAQLPVFEGHTAHQAYLGDYHFELETAPNDSAEAAAKASADASKAAAPASASKLAGAAETVRIPFVSGPLPWKQYADLAWFPWHLPQRSEGVIYDKDGVRLEVLDFANPTDPRVRVRLNVDGKTEEFDLLASEDNPQGEQQHVVQAPQRRATLTLRPDVLDLGFQVRLREFVRKLDPGSEMAAHYSSLVDFLDCQTPPHPIRENVRIALNAPIDIVDPQTGKAWRLFQSSFQEREEWKPGHPEFDSLARGDFSRDQIYLSILSVNSDPGRGLKYLGSLLIVIGMVVVYYQRAVRNRRNSSSS